MAVSVGEIRWRWRVLCVGQLKQRPFFFPTSTPICFTTSTTRRSSSCVVPRALDPKQEEKEDIAYVGKLVAGSFAGAGVIKYGSALFPEITSPNLVLALAIILTPVLVAVFLLVKESRPKL